MPTYKYHFRKLGIQKLVTYKKGQWTVVERERDKVNAALNQKIQDAGHEAALRYWYDVAAEKLARSGGALTRGAHLTAGNSMKLGTSWRSGQQ